MIVTCYLLSYLLTILSQSYSCVCQNPQHAFHSKLTNDQIIFLPNDLNKETRTRIEKRFKVDVNHTIAAIAVFHTCGIMIFNEHIAYLSGLYNQLRKIDNIKK